MPSDVTAKHLYRTENGAVVDLEYVKRYQLRVTDLQTGVVRTFGDSQISELLRLQDDYESPVFNYGYVFNDIAFTGLTISLATQLRLASSVYKIEARIQYLPVILSASTLDPYKFSLTETPPDHMNVAATPWSDWSTPLELTMLADGQNILPISKSQGTTDPRPTFVWVSSSAFSTLFHRIPNAVHAFVGANQQSIPGDRRRGQRQVIFGQAVGVQHFQGVTRFDYGANAVFIQAEPFAVIAPGRCRELAAAIQALDLKTCSPSVTGVSEA